VSATVFTVEHGASMSAASSGVLRQQNAPLGHVGVHRLEDRPGQLVPFQQVAEVEDGRLLLDRIVAHSSPANRRIASLQ
jgi:hypothetical protein